ncbi:MAG TPA: class I adenylate-forming enzyme family protein [Myxococcaceae bacterium]|nr:class I adenylate-forming enzyme family protein [Myxococcaceae bacterium]
MLTTVSDLEIPFELRSDLLGGDPSRTALYVTSGSAALTYGGLRGLALGLAEALRSHAVGPGSRVGFFVPAGPEFAVGLLGGLSAGAAALPIDPSSKGDYLRQLLLALRPSALFTSPSLARRLELAADGLNVVMLDWNEAAGRLRVQCQGWGEAFEIDGRSPPASPRPVGDADFASDALLIATSGTTGTPKLVRLSHRAIRYNMAAHLESLGLTRPYVTLQALGANYSYGLITSFLSTLSAGGTVVVPRFLDRRHIIDAAVEGEADVCLGTPALLRLLTEGTSPQDLDGLARIEIIGIGGDHCPAHRRQAFARALPRARFFVTYGLTEAGPRVSTLPPEEFLTRSDSVGRPLRGVQLEVRDPEGRPCPPGEPGSLFVRTPSLMSGYLVAGGGEPPPPPRPGSWHDTGDLAALDADGYLSLHGRNDRQTKFRGRRFNPAVVERCLESHPSVVSAQVVVDSAAERLVATARVRPGSEGALTQELIAHCRRNLPNALVPSGIECVPDEGIYFKRRRVYSA